MLEIKLFKFDSKTDYLPYYKSYKIKNMQSDTIGDLLKKVNEIENFSFLDEEKFYLRVNNIFTPTTTQANDFITEKNQELLIEPISILRAKNDLIIDIDDYKNKLYILSAFLEEKEIESLIKEKKFLLEYYASNTLHLDRDYIGDHVLLLASELIKSQAENKNKIFKIIGDKENGILNHTSLENRIIEYKDSEDAIFKLSMDYCEKNSIVYVAKEYKEYDLNNGIKQYFANFNIACYNSLGDNSFESLIVESKANYIELESKNFELPPYCTNKKLIHHIAGHILLEAKDNNADFLIVNDEDDLSIFDAMQKKIEKTIGREIELPVVTKAEFVQLLQGEKNINKHKVNLSFLD
ncbi:DUF5644 domain-containing protein [Sulfurimonas sp.]|uniref:DUF5644 domain-containing protein n=1 Tax=Sulfurimonas sp. TaxID=2022749 RepID=UPI0025F1B5C3|nr:DUF5644 domain-containing protein [Sulfurimonas sp.]